MKGFEPIYNNNSKILILGSFPSVISRENKFYYGNPQNRFWKMLEKIFNCSLTNVNNKINFLLNYNIALWDIIKSCQIVGSLDKNLKDIKYVNLKKVLPNNTNVNKILCNGKKCYTLTKKYLKDNKMDFECICLPSTSPANVRFDLALWQNELKELL